ncbi:MAG: hypothetical protein K9H58_08065, partial [Bacteroidales bacterium]|nr:hypothetical protein [Bacteroidales bacterium]
IIDFNYDTLRFAAGADSLKFYGQYFQECVIIKDGAKTPGFLNCTMGGNGYFHDMKVVGDNIDLSGVFQFSNPMAFYGHVTVNDTLQTLATSSYTAYIYGNLTNNGAIKDNVYSTYLYITGDITHNGVWNNYHTYLDGDTDQNLFFTQSFDGGYLTNSNTDGKVISNSTLAFNNTYIDFNNDTLVFSSGADSLILTGRYFQEAVIMKEGSKTSGFLNCTMGGNGYFHDMIIVGDNIDLGGTFQFTAPMAFYGHVTVTGFIQVYASSSYTAYVNGDLTNNGAIKNNVYSTSLYISGDISQNGVWENYYTYLNGSSLQNLSQTSPFACFRIVDTDPSSAIQANTDIEFQNTDVDLGGSTLFMVDNGVITIQDSWFIDADIISNNFDLSMSGISYLSDVSADNVTIYDWVQVRNGCTFSGLTKVEGILSCNNTGSYTLDIDGDIINSGSIQNYSYSLSLNIAGNLFNNGTWSNYRTYLNGSNDQIIYLLNNQEISGTVIFDALSAGAPYQWYFEGGILNSTSFTGETSNNLVWSDPVSPAWYGDFYCQTGAGPSRTITVEGGLIVDISVFLEGSFNGINMNTTLNDNGHIPFTQPYNITPWNYVGTESVASIPPDITDWVLLEFRETTGGSETATPGTMIAQRALFLNNDGYIVNLDGTRDIKIEVPTVNSNLYVVVWHRNHLGVMTSNPVSFDSAPYSYDFTSGESQAYGGALGQNELGGGMYGMMGGDANSDSDVDGADFNIWQSNAGGAANYEKADLNMNNQVNNTDKNDILVGNTGQSSQVPE